MAASLFVGVPNGEATTTEAGVVALKTRSAPRRSGTPVAAGARPAVTPGRRADFLQVLFHLRFDAGRQYRTSGRSFKPSARCRNIGCLPCLSSDRAHALPRPSVRWRETSQRIRHGKAPADAHDRSRYSALVASPNSERGCSGALSRRPARGRCRFTFETETHAFSDFNELHETEV